MKRTTEFDTVTLLFREAKRGGIIGRGRHSSLPHGEFVVVIRKGFADCYEELCTALDKRINKRKKS